METFAYLCHLLRDKLGNREVGVACADRDRSILAAILLRWYLVAMSFDDLNSSDED